MVVVLPGSVIDALFFKRMVAPRSSQQDRLYAWLPLRDQLHARNVAVIGHGGRRLLERFDRSKSLSTLLRRQKTDSVWQ